VWDVELRGDGVGALSNMKDTVGETKDSTIFFPEKGSFEAEKDMTVKTTNAS
jgi:hypothetical protein